MQSLTHPSDIITPGENDPVPGELFTPEQAAEREGQLERLVAESPPAVNLYGERLDQLPPLTLADDLAEVDDAVAIGQCSRSWATSARRLILDRHRAKAQASTGAMLAPPSSSRPASDEPASETTGADPPSAGPGALALRRVVDAEVKAFAPDTDLDLDSVRRFATEAMERGHQGAARRLPDLPYDFSGTEADEVARAITDHYRLPFAPGGAWSRQVARVVPELAERTGRADELEGFLFTMFDLGWALAHSEAKVARRHRGQRAEIAATEQRERHRAERQRHRDAERAQRSCPVRAEPMALVRPHVEVDDGPTEAEQAELALALALAAEAQPDEAQAALALVRQAALAAGDDATARWAKRRLRELRQEMA